MAEILDNIGFYLHYLISFAVIISIIVFVHEYGHYIVAKWCGVKVEAFSIGFGPEIVGWRDKSGTRWKISAFPLGGYVKMFGDYGAASTPDEEKIKKMTKKEKEQSFHFKPLKKKAAIVFAGPLFNYLFAIIALTFFIGYYGVPRSAPEIGEVMKNSAAEAAGLKKGDVIIKMNEREINRFEQIREISSMNAGEPIKITFTRAGKEKNLEITPKLSESKDIFGNKVKVGLIGITSSGVNYEKVGIGSAFTESVYQTYSITKNTLVAIGQIITGKRSSEEISGILRIGKYSGQATEKGFSTVIWFMIILSINLGLINLFPIPLLDGGHLAFYAIEAVKGRPLAEKFQEYSYKVGFALLIALMIFATFNDLKHFNIF